MSSCGFVAVRLEGWSLAAVQFTGSMSVYRCPFTECCLRASISVYICRRMFEEHQGWLAVCQPIPPLDRVLFPPISVYICRLMFEEHQDWVLEGGAHCVVKE